MMPGVSHRSARTAREEDLHYKSADGKTEFVIPRGTAIGMTSMINHWNTELFPNPDEFLPDRWLLEDGTQNYALQIGPVRDQWAKRVYSSYRDAWYPT